MFCNHPYIYPPSQYGPFCGPFFFSFSLIVPPLPCITPLDQAIFYNGQDRTDVAEPLFIECIELKTQVFGATNLTTVVTQNALGNMYLHQERWEEAEFIFADCMEKRKELLGMKHRDTCVSMEGLAEALHQQGKHQQAQPIYVAIVVARKELHGGQHPKSVKASNDLRTCRGYLY